MPGVASAAASTSVPYLVSAPPQRLSADPAGSQAIRAERASVGPEFFATLDVPLRAGRGFTSQDSPVTRTAMVNETAARASLSGPRSDRPAPVDGRDRIRNRRRRSRLYEHEVSEPDRDPKVYLP